MGLKGWSVVIEEWDYCLRLSVCHEHCSAKSLPAEILMQLNYVITPLPSADDGLSVFNPSNSASVIGGGG